jgi:hypothetical protein
MGRHGRSTTALVGRRVGDDDVRARVNGSDGAGQASDSSADTNQVDFYIPHPR